jgi:hypothetical protein
MIYIPFPRTDLDNHPDLVRWRERANKRQGDWKLLKEFLADSARIVQGKHPLTKCWYSELPQGDDFARDVEHFRPKNQASPLNEKQIESIENASEIKYEQDTSTGSYPWLEFDYRNYRIVSAITNRGGAKHIYFPIAKNSTRLTRGQFPWVQAEYPYFLDPTNRHDASLLFVKPNGEIAPLTAKTALTQADFDNLPESWHTDGFNYLRAMVTIKLYRLDDTVFVKGRKEVFDKISRLLDHLVLCIDENVVDKLKERIIEDIIEATLPSAPFSLAAKSALKAYITPNGTNPMITSALNNITNQILNKIEQKVAVLLIDWSKP